MLHGWREEEPQFKSGVKFVQSILDIMKLFDGGKTVVPYAALALTLGFAK